MPRMGMGVEPSSGWPWSRKRGLGVDETAEIVERVCRQHLTSETTDKMASYGVYRSIAHAVLQRKEVG